MNPNTLKWLKLKGWSIERDYDVSSNLSYLAQREWVVFDQAIGFLRSFDCLGEFNGETLNDPEFCINSFSLDSRNGFSWRQEALIIEKYLKISLYPIGYQNICCLLIGSDANLYAVDADITFYRLGNGISESLDNLFSGKFIPSSLTTL